MAKTCKYYKEKQLVSYDSGNTWQPTGLTRRGNLYESDSADCGYMTQYKWEVVSGYVCDVTTYTKYEKTQKFQSTDGGVTWTAVVPSEYGRGNVLEYNSTDCGYEPPIDYSDVYLTFIPISAATSFKYSSTTTSNSVSYSLDEGATWTPLASNEYTPQVQARQKIMWKGILNDRYIGHFRSSGGYFDVEGNAMSLVYGDSFRGQTDLSGKDYAFYELLGYPSNVVNAENMVLPATTLSNYCYCAMFSYCTSLQTAPQLPATTLASHCYDEMFSNCRSLTVAPQLPATTLASHCYENMFNWCTSLTTAPSILPATTLAEHCYASMFEQCHSLTTAPELPATRLASHCYMRMFSQCSGLTVAPVLSAATLVERCYYHMFNNCRSLSSLTCLATNISAYECTRDWVVNVSSSGTFKKASSMTSWTRDGDGIPSGWTVLDYQQ